ncbi:hypothetical protein AVEN_150231-1 [Araneus ventricosus]|uniref:Uncharacterized protein n=1 Tax=Araneus ventricosus TaxID=182803 RepID=A0A4Y2G4N5_ARAVE|nr:hypothetical protein AVEN_150231-1 [Araneus ventricosus]
MNENLLQFFRFCNSHSSRAQRVNCWWMPEKSFLIHDDIMPSFMKDLHSIHEPVWKLIIVQVRCDFDEEDAKNSQCRLAYNGKGLKWKLIMDLFEEAVEIN